MESISELIANEIVHEISVEDYLNWNKNLEPITIPELKQIIEETENISIEICE